MSYVVTPKLGKILKERNMTQKQLADLTGISQPVISRFDRNGQHLDVHLAIISRALGLTIDGLFDIYEQIEFLDNYGNVKEDNFPNIEDKTIKFEFHDRPKQNLLVQDQFNIKVAETPLDYPKVD